MNIRQAMEMYKQQAATPEMHCFIRQEGSQHCVKSHSGKNLGCYQSAEGAKKRLRQVEYFKHKDVKAYGPNTDMGDSSDLDPE